MTAAEERRQKLLEMLEKNDAYLNATKMARELGVSRQVIVSDVAILRERGQDIFSTPRGYLLNRGQQWGYVGTLHSKHGPEAIQDEFYTIVDLGGAVLDVSIEHPIYGHISADMHIRSRYDADMYLEKVAESDSKPLSALTEGFHIHRIGVQNREDFERIQAKLKEKGILWEEQS